MLSMKEKQQEKKRDDAFVKSRLYSYDVGLGLLCSAMPVSGQSTSRRAEIAEFSYQP